MKSEAQMDILQKYHVNGFTLIELLVVMAIISLLASIVMTSVNSARISSRDNARVSSLIQFRTALELYHNDFGQYPKTFDSPAWPVRITECYDSLGWATLGLAPVYMSQMPTDPAIDCDGVAHSWAYASDGVDYKVALHPEEPNQSYSGFFDPTHDGGTDDCVIDGTTIYHYAIWTPGAVCWPL